MIELTDHEISDCVSRLADIQARQAELTRQADAIKTILRGLGPVNRRQVGHVKLTVAPNHRFDHQLARAVLTPDQLRRISLWLPDAAIARQELPSETFQECCKEYAMIVRIT